ncbi:hypothetical protein ABZ499_30610 [Streptomyces sp. NPDC019990]|uniref:hypothetical protein n=1 Tax=Streptomyces sp. NPDC019990 TaxID=3154693 RepID=UPI0033E9BB84
MRPRPGPFLPKTRFTPRAGRPRTLTSVVTSAVAAAVLTGLAVQPGVLNRLADAVPTSSDNPEDWFETTADEQLRFD